MSIYPFVASICINYITKTGQILEPVCTFQGSFSLFFSWTCRHLSPQELPPNLEGVFPVKLVRLLTFLQSPDTSEKCTAHPRSISLTACCPSANVSTTNTNIILHMIGSLLPVVRWYANPTWEYRQYSRIAFLWNFAELSPQEMRTKYSVKFSQIRKKITKILSICFSCLS
jgi:hypothetical protein